MFFLIIADYFLIILFAAKEALAQAKAKLYPPRRPTMSKTSPVK
jgi:hypothetical protein